MTLLEIAERLFYDIHMRINVSHRTNEERKLPLIDNISEVVLRHPITKRGQTLNWTDLKLDTDGRVTHVRITCPRCGHSRYALYNTLRQKQWDIGCMCDETTHEDVALKSGSKILNSKLSWSDANGLTRPLVCHCGYIDNINSIRASSIRKAGDWQCKDCYRAEVEARSLQAIDERLRAKQEKSRKKTERHTPFGLSRDSSGMYLMISVPSDHWLYGHCPQRNATYGYMFHHRFVISEHLGRPLARKEIVHHKNGIKTDNRLDNLQLLVSDKHHHGSGDCDYYLEWQKAMSELVELKALAA